MPGHRSRRSHPSVQARKRTGKVSSSHRPAPLQDQGPQRGLLGTPPVVLDRPAAGNLGKPGPLFEGEPSDQHSLAGLDKKLLEHAFYTFMRQFPEFSIFHQPSFLTSLDQQRVPALLLCAILALTARFIPKLATQHGSPAKASEYFANHVRQDVMSHAVEARDISSCQALVMLCLYDWGEGYGSRAWVYNGMASRIAHGIHARAQRLAEQSSSTALKSQLEEARRTVWACFLVDAMIGCGKCQASNHAMSVRGIPLPSGEDDFTFENHPTSNEIFLDLWDPEMEEYHPLPPAHRQEKMGCDRSLALILRGFYIWHTISAWASSGGSRREAAASREPPWRECSFWARSLAALEDWRGSQRLQLHYSASSMNLRVYISRGEGERYAVINLIYYLSIIFLHREYLQYAPPYILSRSSHTDIIDSTPLPLGGAPNGWWEQSRQALLDSSSNIIQIMQELDERGVVLQTPFSCFCVFSAATCLLQASHDAARKPITAERSSSPTSPVPLPSSPITWASAWLARACKVWKLACGWYRTLQILIDLYTTQVRIDSTDAISAQDDLTPTLEENIKRLGGLENVTESGDAPIANILLLLQRQQKLKQSHGALASRQHEAETMHPPSAITPPATAQHWTGSHPPILSDDLRLDVGVEPPLPFPAFSLDPDLFNSILTDSTGDSLRFFPDLGSSLG
ncbi:hypothetical protein ABHI18_000038 [Aspergillus niger]